MLPYSAPCINARHLVHLCIVVLVVCAFCVPQALAAPPIPKHWDCYYAWADKTAWDTYQETKAKTPCCAQTPRIFADSLPSVGVDHDAAVVGFWATLYQLAAHDHSYRGRHVVTGPKCVAKAVAP